MTQVPRPVLTDVGLSIPSDAVVKAGVMADMDAAMGGGMNLSQDENPLGQLATTEAAIIGDKNSQFLSVINQVDPKFASGRMQDAIARIYFIERFAARATAVNVNCYGADGTVITAGSRVRGSDNQTYASSSAGTIANGFVSIPFSCEATGPIPCGAGNLTTSAGGRIVTNIAGWESIENVGEGTLGADVEGRAAFEERRVATVAKNGTHTLSSIRAAVLEVADVLDVYAVENTSDVDVVKNGVTVPAHGIFASVVGGSDTEVAAAIRSKISGGCNMGGNTTIEVPDNDYADPKPTYATSFNRPDSVSIKFGVVLSLASAIPSDGIAQVKNAVINAFAGGDGLPRAGIGRRLFASRFYPPVASLGSWAASIIDIQLGVDQPNQFSTILTIDKNPTVSFDDISVTFA